LAKKSRPAPIRTPTRRQLSRWRRERRVQRITLIAGCIFLVFILAYAGYGFYTEELKPLNQTVLKVDDSVFKMNYYLKLLKFYSRGQEDAMLPTIAELSLGAMEQGEVLRQEAPKLGFHVTDEEVKQGLKDSKLPDDKAHADLVAARMLTARLLEDYFDPMVPKTCEQAYVQAMLLQDEDTATEVARRVADGEDFLALAKEFTVEPVTKSKGGDLGWLPRGYLDILLGLDSQAFEDMVFSVAPGKVSEPVFDASVTKNIGYWIVEVLEKDESKGSHIRGILLGTKKEALEIRERLEKGEDFATLAKEFSQDETSGEQGGDLGWVQRWGDTSTLSRLAFSLEPGSLSQPTPDASKTTKGGYWLIKVVEKDPARKLDEEVRETLKTDAFANWLNEVRKSHTIERLLTDEQKMWAIKKVLKQKE